VAILARIIQFVLWVLVATWLGRKLFRWVFGRPAQRQAVPNPEPRALHRDPWCGTYVSSEISHTLERAGQVHHFCSTECRERFLISAQRGASPDKIGASA